MMKKIGKLVIYFVLICVGYIYLEPIMKMVSRALMPPDDIIDPSIEWLAKSPTFANFGIASKVLDIPRSLLNSILFSTAVAVIQTIVAAMTGYALSRFQFAGKKMWFVMILMTFIIPVTLLTVPRLMIFMVMQEVTGLQMIGTVIPQILLASTGQGINSTILILIFWNFFNLIPYSLDEAAMLDGAGAFQIFYYIVVRMSASSVLIVFLFAFVWNWNETYQTSTYLGNGLSLLTAKLNVFNSQFSTMAAAGSGSANRINEAYKMAATLISIAPLLLLYGCVQKQFIQGIENTGITGE